MTPQDWRDRASAERAKARLLRGLIEAYGNDTSGLSFKRFVEANADAIELGAMFLDEMAEVTR